MGLEQALALAGLCLLGAASPGPSLAVVVQATLLGSPRRGFATALGHGLGVALYAALTAGGLGLLIHRLPFLFVGLQLAGALYLLWMAIGAWRAGSGEAPMAASGQDETGAGGGFVPGMLVALLNPKLAIFMLALFSQFLSPEAGLLHAAVVVGIAGGIDALWYCAVVLGLQGLPVSKLLTAQHDRLSRLFALALGALAIAVIVNALRGF
jgi:threonine/homoserine/homoserine lactone efflux protein